MKQFLFLAVLFVAAPCFAAAGACPSGVQYTNPAAPVGALKTAAQLGCTGAYYVAANGLDSNTGASEAAPFLHAPFMPGCASACATAQSGMNGTNAAGIWIIFRGGDSWHFGNSALSPYVSGTWEFNTGSFPNGTAAHPTYFGIDNAWFSGASWVRPILTGDNPLCNANVLGSNCHADTFGGFYVDSCGFGMPSLGSNSTFVDLANRNYFVFDNFEMTGLCQSGLYPVESNNFFSYASGSGNTNPVFEHLYMHGITHIVFCSNPGLDQAPALCADGAHAGFGIFGFASGGGPPGPIFDTLIFNVMDGSDSDTRGWGVSHLGPLMYHASYNEFTGTSQTLAGGRHIWSNNVSEFAPDNGHSNVLEDVGVFNGNNVMFNNVWRHLSPTGIGASNQVGYWPDQLVGTTQYVFNNVWYDYQQHTQEYNVGENNTNMGPTQIFNNTFENTINETFYGCANTALLHQTYTVTWTNDHVIGDVTPYRQTTDACSAHGTAVTNLPSGFTSTYTHTQATTDGYTSAQTFVYSPIASNKPTVGQGTNLTSTVCANLQTAANSDPILQDAATACLSDTTYAVAYNKTNHTVSFPARTPNVRPPSGAWDIGAYQFQGASQATAPSCSPGSGNYLVAQSVTCTNPNTGTTVACFTTNGATPATNGLGTGCTTGTKYTTTITVSTPETLEIIAGTSTLTDSTVVSNVYTFNLTTPSFTPPAGNYASTQNVTINCDAGATACYTTDGSTPTASTPGTCSHGTPLACSSNFSVSNSQTVEALATESGNTNSAVATGVYTIGITYLGLASCSQSAVKTESTGNSYSWTCTPANIGDAIVSFAQCHPSSGNITGISLTAPGWTITQLVAPLSTGSNSVGALFGAVAPNTSATTFTATFAGAANCSAFAMEFSDEFSGNNTAGGAATFNATAGTSGAVGSCNQTGANVTPPLNNEAVYFACFDQPTDAVRPFLVGAGSLSEYDILAGGAGVAQTPSVLGGGSGVFIIMGTAIVPAGVNVMKPAAPALNMLVLSKESYENSRFLSSLLFGN